ncbi:MAG: beta-galactosidase [Verrucomicrobiota bacterium JB024]|nr:beta-galactosidase [Verrucomicrobiota bacterium JB024]
MGLTLLAWTLATLGVNGETSWRPTARAVVETLPIAATEAREGFAVEPTPEAPWPTREAIVLLASELRATLPLDVPLPAGVRTVSVWVRDVGQSRAAFHFREADGKTFTVHEENLEAQPYFSATDSVQKLALRVGPWTRKSVYLQPGHTGLVLESLDLRRLRGAEGDLGVGDLEADLTATSPHDATEVWKLKDVQLPRPSSLYYTAARFFEYGYDVAPYLRLTALSVFFDTTRLARVELLLRTTTWKPLWSEILPYAEDGIVTLPRCPEGAYYLEIRGYDSGGTLLGREELVLEVLRNDAGRADPLPQPVNTPYTVEGLAYGQALSAGTGPVALTVKCNSDALKISSPLSYCWEVTDILGQEVGSGQGTLPAADAPISIRFQPQGAGRYDLDLTLNDPSGSLVQAVQERVFVAEAEPAKLPSAPDEELTQERGQVLFVANAHLHQDKNQTERLPIDYLPTLLEWMHDEEMTPVIQVGWNELEPAQGLYQWSIIDEVLDRHASADQPLMLGVRLHGDNIPDWLWFEETMSQNQKTIRHDYHYISPMGPRFQREHVQLWVDIAARYRHDPRVAGYFVTAGASEGFLTDTGNLISEYASFARRDFRDWLKARYGDLSALNASWKSHYAAWDEVQPPLPDFTLEWESSPAWWDFHQFKRDFVKRHLDTLQSAIREEDSVRPMLMYAYAGFGDNGALAPVFIKNRFRFNLGSGEYPDGYRASAVMRSNGVQTTVESHYVPPNVGALAMLFTNGIIQGGFQGQILQYGMVWTKIELEGTGEQAGRAQIIEGVQVVSEELSQAEPAVPWAGYYSGTSSMLRTRSFRNNGFRPSQELYRAANEAMHLPGSWVDDTSSSEALAKYPLLVDAHSDVLTAEAVEELLAYIEAGGTLICAADTARWQPGSPEPVDALLSALGADHVQPLEGQGGGVGPDGYPIILEKSYVVDWKPGAQARELSESVDGEPVVWEVLYGEGLAVVTAGPVDFERSARWLQGQLERRVKPSPFRIDAANTVVGVLESPQAWWIVATPQMPDRKLNHTLAQMRRVPTVTLSVTGEFPAGVEAVSDVISGQSYPIKGGSLEAELMPGFLHLFKIPKTVR